KEPDSPWETVEVAAFEGADGLVMLINTILEPCSWRMTGGNVGSIYSYGNVLVVDHTVETHRQIAKLLDALRSMLVDH
ncbi:MAG: hypothetical protein O7D94_12200, partial [Planctomycetota bacterium]|nr:hypothetical protein [Planctomycetota bacterium]